MNEYAKILWQAYERFLLPLGGKIVPTPYRINIPFQPDRRKYGKSDPDTLTKDVIELAQQQMFDLENASIDQIRKFMGKNMLGIDCSGFVYHLLDYLLEKIGKGGMEKAGFPKASKTDVKLLTSDQLSSGVDGFKNARAGDLIKLNSDQDLAHCLVVLEDKNNILIYAHSSRKTTPSGVHIGKVYNNQLSQELSVYSFNTQAGDGIYRLLMLK